MEADNDGRAPERDRGSGMYRVCGVSLGVGFIFQKQSVCI